MQFPFQSETREVIVRKKEKTNPSWGHDPSNRTMKEHIENGVINLDKPSGPTSHQVSAWVKCIFGLNKAGHGGTLDPAVTGILPIALENATKIIKTTLKGGKEYVAVMHLHGEVHEGKVRDIIPQFVGRITQLPPKRSSVKRVLRQREIYYIEFLEKQERDVMFKVGCQAGTYIRRLCEDWGKLTGVGGHMIELRRTRAGGFTEKDKLVTLQDLADAYAFWKEEGNEKYLRYCIQPMEVALKNYPKIWVFDSAIDSLCHGAKLAVRGISVVEDGISNEDEVAVLSLKGELVGLGVTLMGSSGLCEAESGIGVKMDRIVMKPGAYPKFWKTKEEEKEKNELASDLSSNEG